MTTDESRIEDAAAYLAGLTVGRQDVRDPSHPVWLHMKKEYKESYRHRARTVRALLEGDESAKSDHY